MLEFDVEEKKRYIERINNKARLIGRPGLLRLGQIIDFNSGKSYNGIIQVGYRMSVEECDFGTYRGIITLVTHIEDKTEKIDSIWANSIHLAILKAKDNGYEIEGFELRAHGDRVADFHGMHCVTAYLRDVGIRFIKISIPKNSIQLLNGIFREANSINAEVRRAKEKAKGLDVVIDVSQMYTGECRDMSALFHNSNVTEIIGLENLDTSNAGSMEYMFCRCHRIPSIDIQKWDMSRVTSVRAMFRGCGAHEIKLNKTSKNQITDMSSMFRECDNIEEIDISGMMTDKVRDMAYIFDGCSAKRIRAKGISLSGIRHFETKNDMYFGRLKGKLGENDIEAPYQINNRLLGLMT